MARVLVCDDSGFMRDMIKEYLDAEGHDVVGFAANGDDALDQYVKLKPDVVTMDIVMQPDGIGAIEKIIAYDGSAKVIIVTVLEGGQSAVVDGIRAGAMGYVTKPVKKEQLIREVNRITGEM